MSIKLSQEFRQTKILIQRLKKMINSDGISKKYLFTLISIIVGTTVILNPEIDDTGKSMLNTIRSQLCKLLA